MKTNYLSSIAVASFVLLMFVGCTNDSTATDSDPVNKTDSSKTADSDPAKENGDSKTTPSKEKDAGSIPDDFPADIHIVDGAETTDFQSAGGKDNLILEYSATDNSELVESYQDGMAGQGWTKVVSSELPIGVITNFSKDDRKCTISIGPPKDGLVKVAIIVNGN